jgi:hypothetical protein
MDVMASARSLGLITDQGSASGTIDEATVLSALSELAVDDPADDDLYADAAMAVQLARSAGVVQPDSSSILHRSRPGLATQLRYRSEMAAVFVDLAIDVGLRNAEATTSV